MANVTAAQPRVQVFGEPGSPDWLIQPPSTQAAVVIEPSPDLHT